MILMRSITWTEYHVFRTTGRRKCIGKFLDRADALRQARAFPETRVRAVYRRVEVPKHTRSRHEPAPSLTAH